MYGGAWRAISPIWGIGLQIGSSRVDKTRMSLATAFIQRFRAADQIGTPLSLFADDPDGFGAALTSEPMAFADAIGAALGRGHGPLVTLHQDCFATAACDRDGSVVVAGAGFSQWFDSIDPFDALVRNMRSDVPKVSMLADDRDGRPVALAAGTVAVARRWPLDDAVREALDSGKANYAIAAFRAGELSWDHSAQAYGLTQAESMLVSALARLGDLQRAAAERGIAYETARKFVAAAMRKTGAKRQSELVRLALMVTAGDIPDAQNLEQVVCDLFGLTERQAKLTVILAQGATRDRAAGVLGISEHRAKADLKIVFQACGVANAVDLARLVAEINALKGLASACEVTVTAPGREGEPLRFIPRTWADGRIAVSDFGPATGAPVLVMHSTMMGRHHSQSFITALQQAGFRPIAMDRAGFGLTDRVEGNTFTAGVRDIEDVLDALGLDQVAIVARCTVASVIACNAAANRRIVGGVLVWPDAPTRQDAPERKRMTDRARELFVRYPKLALPFAEMLCRRTSAAMIETLWRNSAAGVPSDLRLLGDPSECADIVRGSRQAIQGMHGFLEEALQLGLGLKLEPLANGERWTGLFGTGYESYDVKDAVAFWGNILPDGVIRIVEDGVHFLHVTHSEEVITGLNRAFAR
jgi:DNA-binding CsgD family transcriptional regulator/pimeloyl-ACP methyl ester carboxylesterase